MDTLKQFQMYWDTMLEGDTAQRRKMKFVPLDASKIHFPKDGVMKDEYDEWLARIICFAFSIPPTALIKEVNRSVAETTSATAMKEGLVPLLNWIKNFLDRLIIQYLEQPDVEFKWKIAKELSPVEQSKVHDTYIKAKVITVDEVRSDLGKERLTDEQRAELNPPPPPGLGGEIDTVTGLPKPVDPNQPKPGEVELEVPKPGVPEPKTPKVKPVEEVG
jgi:hypothetical protein